MGSSFISDLDVRFPNQIFIRDEIQRKLIGDVATFKMKL